MNSFFKLSFILVLALANVKTYAQPVPISQEGTVTVTCGGDPVIFTDSNETGNYAAGESYTITFCPDGGNAVFFLIDSETQGDIWDVAAGDVITIYDGDTENSPILGTFNTSIAGPVIYYAATVENLTGCLTINFTSSEISNTGAGWTSQINCGNQWQPFSIELETEPTEMIEGNYIDICQGETVNFTANGVFPYSDGSGYEQNNDNCYFEWDLGDGTELEGFGLTEVSNSYSDEFGFPIKITVTDPLGLINIFEASVRVSTTPNFGGVIAEFQDTICLGSTTTLIGGISQDTTQSFGAFPVPTSFIGGGFLAGQTFLPDGNGASYETSVVIDDFPIGTLFENESDIVAVCATMEHSYLGDLDIELICPDGTEIILVEQTGGSTNLGIPWATGPVDGQSANNTPGVGFEYCWRPDAANGTFEDEANQNDMEFVSGDGPGTYNDSQMLEGSYLPFEPISDLLGCPINGSWTIRVTDNIGADNGYIFSWGIQFDPLIDPNAETYQPILVDGFWGDDPSIIAGNDTNITVQPTETGVFDYTFFVEDNFGCNYDTTVVLTVVEAVTSNVNSPACNFTEVLQVNNSSQGGTWSVEETPEDAFASFGVDDVVVNLAGDYVFTYTDFACQTTDIHDVFFVPLPTAEIIEELEICQEEPQLITPEPQHPLLLNPSYIWKYEGDSLGTLETQNVQLPGQYSYQVYDPQCDIFSLPDFLDLTTRPCAISTYNVFTPNADGMNDNFFIQSIEESIYDGSELFVYNRWGNLIFEAVNYANDWDMADVVDGTYFYVLNVNNGDTHKGSFTVIRESN